MAVAAPAIPFGRTFRVHLSGRSAYAQSLLHAGLGSSADEVVLEPREDAAAVTLVARGSWPVLTAPFGGLSLPLRAEARIERERWRP